MEPRDGSSARRRVVARTSVGVGLARFAGLSWLLAFALLGWGLAGLVRLQPERPRRLDASPPAVDAQVEFYGNNSEVVLTLVSRLDTSFDAERMVLTVPVLDSGRETGGGRHVSSLKVVVPAGARTLLVAEDGVVTVLDRPLPPPVLQALGGTGSTVAERIESSRAALAALRSLPRVREFLIGP